MSDTNYFQIFQYYTNIVIRALDEKNDFEEMREKYDNFYYKYSLDGNEECPYFRKEENRLKFKSMLDFHEYIQTEIMDCVYIGPYDLSQESHGFITPEKGFQKLSKHILKTCPQKSLEQIKAKLKL